jgi:hypothetical protein
VKEKIKEEIELFSAPISDEFFIHHVLSFVYKTALVAKMGGDLATTNRAIAMLESLRSLDSQGRLGRGEAIDALVEYVAYMPPDEWALYAEKLKQMGETYLVKN